MTDTLGPFGPPNLTLNPGGYKGGDKGGERIMGDKGAALLPAALHVLGSNFPGGGRPLLRPWGPRYWALAFKEFGKGAGGVV